MARVNSKDTTNVYRYMVTTEGVHLRDGYGYREGEAYVNVKFHGPYYTRIPFSPWTSPREKTTIETQKLSVVQDELMWLTERVKVIEPATDAE